MGAEQTAAGPALGELLRMSRLASGLSQEELGERAGLSVRTIREIERGRVARPYRSTVGSLSAALDLRGSQHEEFVRASRPTASAAAGGRPVQPRAVPVSDGAGPHELPAPVRHFMGRSAELGVLTQCQDQDSAGRADTVVISAIGGTAGVGKTALAVHWAHQVADRFPDGQLYVNLRGYDLGQPVTASEALGAFLRSLGVPAAEIPAEAEERAARYRSKLCGRRVLVVLDNAREVDQVRLLLPGSDGCAAVVTSRNSLAGLVARDGARRLDLDLLPLADAVELLYALIGERVRREPDAAAVLADRCARLPLALRVAAELAAARPLASLAELAGELSDLQRRLDLLDAGGDRRTAVRSVLSWSYDRLDPQAARVFRLCGLHPGPDLDAFAAAALTGTPAERSGGILEQLRRAHLVQATRAGRYAMHDLLRGYGRQAAADEDGRQQCRAAVTSLFDYYLFTASAAMDQVFPHDRDWRPVLPQRTVPTQPIADRRTALAWLDAELSVMSSIVACAAAEGRPEHAVGLAAMISQYLTYGAHILEATGIYGHARAAAVQIGDGWGEARAIAGLGTAALQGGSYATARVHYERALALFRQLGHHGGEFRVVMNLGGIALAEGQPQRAADCFGQALELARQTGKQVDQARALANLSAVDILLCRWPQAVQNLQVALVLSGEIDDQASQAHVRRNLGYVYLQQCCFDAAADELRQCLELARASGYRQAETDCLVDLGRAVLGQGHIDSARTYLEEAREQAHADGNVTAESHALAGIGEVLLASGQPAAARGKYVAALALSEHTEKYTQASAHAGLARAYRASRQLQQARHHWRCSLDLYTEAGSPEAEQVRAELSSLREPGDNIPRDLCNPHS